MGGNTSFNTLEDFECKSLIDCIRHSNCFFLSGQDGSTSFDS